MSAQLTFRDKMIPWYFVIFFVVIAVVDGVMVMLAVDTHTGTVSKHPYEQGLAYNKVVEASNEQDKLGWKSDISYADGRLDYVLRDRDGKIIQPESATASFFRPVKDGMDFKVELVGSSNEIKFPTKGLWEVTVTANHEGKKYQHSQRIVVE